MAEMHFVYYLPAIVDAIDVSRHKLRPELALSRARWARGSR
jgi:hypothetical protein